MGAASSNYAIDLNQSSFPSNVCRIVLFDQAIFNAVSEFQFVAWLIETNRYAYDVWIGMTDLREEGNYEWRSGRTSSFDVARHWGQGGDQGSDSDYDCLGVSDGQMWVNPCTFSRRYGACQKRRNCPN